MVNVDNTNNHDGDSPPPYSRVDPLASVANKKLPNPLLNEPDLRNLPLDTRGQNAFSSWSRFCNDWSQAKGKSITYTGYNRVFATLVGCILSGRLESAFPDASNWTMFWRYKFAGVSEWAAAIRQAQAVMRACDFDEDLVESWCEAY